MQSKAMRSVLTIVMTALLASLSLPLLAETVYVVKRGDTLTGVADKYDVSIASLADENAISRKAELQIGQRLVIPGQSESSAKEDSKPITYIVKRGDTLTGVAEQYRMPLSRLAKYNGLAHTAQLKIGQRLLIPTKSSSASSSSALTLPASVQRAIDTAPVRRGRWKYIVIHHSGVDEGTMNGMDRVHREERHMENGLAYHFVIGNGHGMGDGAIGVGARWKGQLNGGHLRSETQNTYSIGICLVGNFEKHAPTSRQLASLEVLVEALMKRCNLTSKAVKTHRQINIVGTLCPGRKFPTKAFVARLKP